jgi:hypothetical protein
MKRLLLAFALLSPFTFLLSPVLGQSGLYIPSAKPVKNMQKALTNPPTFQLLLCYQGNDSSYSVNDLDLLDSAYRIAFDIENPNYYTMTVESYGNGDDSLGQRRVDGVVRYFAMRSYAPFPIRMAHNPIRCSCHGDTVETLRFEVPTSTAVYNYSELPEARRLLNKTIPLENSVLVTFKNDPDECVGTARGCFMPSEDSLVRGYYATLFLARGSVYSVAGTKDTCPGGLQISVDDHLDYRQTVERYKLIPHPKQILVQAGYIIVKSNFGRGADECELEQKDSVFVRIPATPEQLASKLKFFAKVKTTRGIEYKALPTRKLPGKGDLVLQAPISVDQFDTIYLGKRIQEKELKDYFYEVDSPTEAAAFAVGKRFFVAYRVDKHGQYELKKALRNLFRIVPEQEEDFKKPSEKKELKGEEIIED